MLRILAILLLPLALWSCGDRQQTENDADQATTETSPTLSEEEVQTYRHQGSQAAQATFGVLSGQLMSALKEGGVPNAIDYCNVAAYPLTDSMAQAMQAHIRRTALRYRNPQNAPTEAERRVLEQFQAQMQQDGPIKPVVEPYGPDSVAFYAPIVLQAPCQKCHGEVGTDIAPDDYDLITQRYPEDQAVNFAEGDLRGMWSIRFARQ